MMTMGAAASTKRGPIKPSAPYRWAHAIACYVLAAALTAGILALGLPAELNPSTGEPLNWWRAAAQFFTRLLPWVIAVSIVVFIPIMGVLRARLPLGACFVLAPLVGVAPAILFGVACVLLPPLHPLAPLAFVLGIAGAMTALVGFSLQIAVFRHLWLLAVSAGVLIILAVATTIAM
jgi:hypothetical protein